MPVFIKDEHYVLFPHVPKTGGTSVERLFQKSGWGVHLRSAQVGPGTVHYVRRCSPQHMHAALLREIIHLARVDLTFLVVRDPIARFRSEYAMRQKDPSKTDPASVDAWAEKVLGRYARNPYALDNHLRPQHEFLLPGSEVYRLEDSLEAMVDDLNDRFGLALTGGLAHSLKGSERHGIASRDVEISPMLEKTLRELYDEDYRQFGY